MSACGCDHSDNVDEEVESPWYRDLEVLIPFLSGAFLLIGFVLDAIGIETVSTVLYWISLLLGAYTFVPGSIRKLFNGKVGIGLLMTISALGAVILGYVGEAAALAFLYSIAEALEDKAMDRARGSLSSLLKLIPETALRVTAAGTETIAVTSIRLGDILRVRAGERVATDGTLIAGASALDTSAITGESVPRDVGIDDAVVAGSINTSGPFDMRATASGKDNSLTAVVDLVREAQKEKGDRGRLADRIARPLVPGVIVLALTVAIVGSLLGDPQLWITRALIVLVAASPCAIAIAVPITVVSGIGAASKNGVIVKSGRAFEDFGKVRQVAFDKTGTLTKNKPAVTKLVRLSDRSQDDVLSIAAALESGSSHPIAQAILKAAPQSVRAQDVAEGAGVGMSGTINGRRVRAVGAHALEANMLATHAAHIETLEREGNTVVVVEEEDKPIGLIAIRDELRSEAPEALEALHASGYRSIMLTGDNEATAQALADQAGIDRVHARLRPADKAHIIHDIEAGGPVAMVGDGINDSPALASATVGVAMGRTGTDAAIESADIVFMGQELTQLHSALVHARVAGHIINQNIILSLLIIAILPPLAITGVLGLAAVVFVHEVAEIIVILNGLRAGRRPAR